MRSETICDLLQVWAAKRPSQPAIVSPAGELSFYDLDLQVDECAKGLSAVGFEPGMRAVLMVRPSIEFAVLAFAMLRFGVIPVLVDPGMGKRNLGECLNQAQPEGFIGVPLAHIGRLLFGWAEKTTRLFVTVGGLRLWGGESYQSILTKGAEAPEIEPAGKSPDDPAAIVFTSGSTGVPKGVIYTHRILRRQVELLQQEYSIAPGEVDLATFPLFALFDPAMGVTAVFPDMNFTRPGQVAPEKIIEPIHKYEVTHMFGSPALIDRVGRFASAKGVRLKSLKRALSAGAPVSSRILRRFQSCLPEAASIYTPYGATEALPLCSIAASERLALEELNQGKGVCVGRPLPAVIIRTIKISDSPIPVWSEDLRLSNGEVGELVAAGDNVSREYFAHPEANELAKIRENDTVLHRTGDLGYIDESGRVWFCGRKAHRVETETETLFSVCCEVVFDAHPAVFRSALVGVGPPPQKPVLCVELEKHIRPSDSLKAEILELGRAQPQTQRISTVLFHPAFPVDIRHNAKIFREKLAAWAAEELA